MLEALAAIAIPLVVILAGYRELAEGAAVDDD